MGCALNPDTGGMPIVLLHGVTSSIYFWTPQLVAELLSLGPCYAVTLPGHYPATFPAGFRAADLTAELMTGLLVPVVQELGGGKRVLLVGHSTGGFAALAVATAVPELTRAVISIAGFAQGQWQGVLGLYQWLVRRGDIGRMAFKTVYRWAQRNPAVYRWSARLYAGDVAALYGEAQFPDLIERNFPPFQALNLDNMAIYFHQMPKIDISGRLTAVTAPTLVLTGDADPIVPLAQSRLIANHIPQAELVVLPGVGHFLFAERPEMYHRAMTDWLAKFGLEVCQDE